MNSYEKFLHLSHDANKALEALKEFADGEGSKYGVSLISERCIETKNIIQTTQRKIKQLGESLR